MAQKNSKIDGENINFKKNIMCLILRYNTLESYNQQLAVNPEFYEFLKRKHKTNFELFASSLNCNYDNYCSLFYDLEKEFNSLFLLDSGKTSNTFFTEQTMPFDFLLGTKLSSAFSKSSNLLVCCFTSSAVEFPWSCEIFRENAITSPASWDFVTISTPSVDILLTL